MEQITNRTIFIALVFLLVIVASCKDNRNLWLTKTKINTQKVAEGVIEIDTLDVAPEKGIYIVNVVEYGALGKFSLRNVIIKQLRNGQSLEYLIEKHSNCLLRISKEYLAFVDESENKGWGWYYVKGNQISNSLPKSQQLIDSLKLLPENKDFYIGESNGIFFFNKNGRRIKSINYGNLVTKIASLDFESLDYKLYKLVAGDIEAISANGNDLLKQSDGIYFIPSPGYKVVAKFNKMKIYGVVDSISQLSNPPENIEFNLQE
ncbi:hypothetical protein [Pinibacter aurantiacus]|uniref:Uncharacterized protein n=1 Tax=Pinibacter aurantiacus TaxID=2851599 RepID=A0A9E2W5U0_9BACT|nr:hypothetical protein [Pinibacter aurantiacus]MBV4359028.1 hypothetical protein [Pinibacter aurantiacus]